MANINIPVTIQIRNAEFQKLASDQIRKQLSNDIAKSVSFTGNLTKEFKDATASADAFTGRIVAVARLINKGFTFKDRNVKAYFDTLTEGGKVAVTRLVTLQKAIDRLQTGKISANAFNKILNNRVLPDPLDSSDTAKAFRSLVNSTVTAAALDYERLTKKVESEAKKQKRALDALRQKTVGDSVSSDLFRERSSDNPRVSNLRSDIVSRLNAQVQAEQKAADDYVKSTNFIEDQVRKALSDLDKAFAARETLRQGQAGSAAQLDIKKSQEENEQRARTLKDDIKERISLRDREEREAAARQLEGVRNVALTSGNEARSIFQEAKKDARSLVRSGIISKEDFDVINRRFADITTRVQEINRIKAKDANATVIAGVTTSGASFSKEVTEGRELLDILARAKQNAEARKTVQQESEDAARRLNVLEERNNEIYEKQLRSIIKRQALAKETIAAVGSRLRERPSQELVALSNFANADPRTLVSRTPPGGGPPRPPGTGGSEDFYGDDDAARRTVTRLRSIVAQQGKFNGLVQRFGELTGLAAKRYGAFLLGTFAITRLTSAFATANQEALVFERLIGRLSQTIRVFNDSLEQARSRGLAVSDTILEAGRRTGVASNEIAQGVVEIAQAGNEQLGALQFIADQLANTQLSASFDDIKSTAEGLIAVQGQFNLQLSDTGSLLDKINQVSVEYAVESGNFFEAVKRGGATFAGLGGTFEEFIEYLTLIRSATRETAPTLGVFFKTGLGRLSKSAQQQIFSEFGVAAPGQNRSVIDQLRDLAENQQFQSLSDTERIRTTIALFGAQQAGRGEALLRELGKESGRERTVQDVIGDSTGSIGRDIKIVEEDVNRSFGRIGQSFQSLINILLQDKSVRSFFKAFADGVVELTAFLNANREIINFLVKLASAIAAVAVALKGLDFARGLQSGLVGGIQSLTGSIGAVGGAVASRGQSVSRLGSPFFSRDNIGTFSDLRNSRTIRRIGVGAGAVAGVGLLAASAISSGSSRQTSTTAGLNGALSGGLTGVTAGALIGSVIPVVGTVVGGIVGGVGGTVIGAIKGVVDNNVEALRANTDRLDGILSTKNILNPDERNAFARDFRSQVINRTALNNDTFNSQIIAGLRGEDERFSTTDTALDFIRSQKNPINDLLSQSVRDINFSDQEIADPKLFQQRFLKESTKLLNGAFNSENSVLIGQELLGLAQNFITQIFDVDKEIAKRRAEANIIRQNQQGEQDFDTSILEGVFQNLRSAAFGFEVNIGIINKGFEKLSEGINRIVTDFTSVRDLSLSSNDTTFRESIGLNLSNIVNRRNDFVDQANFLLGSSDTSPGSQQIPDLIKALKEVELPSQGAASELDVVQNIENLVNSTLGGFDDDVRATVVNVLGTIKATTGDLQSALQTFLSADFDPSKFADNAFQLDKFTSALRDSFGKFVDNVNALTQKTLENNAKLQEVYSQRVQIESTLLDLSLQSGETEISRAENRSTFERTGALFNRAAGDRFFAGQPLNTAQRVGGTLVNANRNLIESQQRSIQLERDNASPRERAQQQAVVTDNLIKYNTALREVNEKQDNLAKGLDLARKAVSSFQDALNETKSGLRSLGQTVLSSDPAELRNQGNLVEGFRRFITRGSGSLDENIRDSVGRLGSREEAQKLIDALGNVPNLPLARDSQGVVTGQNAIDILLEEIGLRFFGTASGRGSSGRSEIEELIQGQKEDLRIAREQEDAFLREQRELQNQLLTANTDTAKALGLNTTSLETNTKALDNLAKILDRQVQDLSSNLIDPERTGNILNANLQVQVDDIKVSFDTQNLSQFGQNAVADALNRVGQVLTDLYIDEPEKLAKVKLLNVQANRIT